MQKLEESPKSSPKSTQSTERAQSRSYRGTPETADPPTSSPVNAFTFGVDNEFALEENIDNIEREEDNIKLDSRSGRRKTDRPRKRKRESAESPVSLQSPDEQTNCDIQRRNSSVSDNVSPAGNMDECALNLSSENQNVSNSPSQLDTHRLAQQGPKDLSVLHKPPSKGDSNLNTPGNVMSNSVHELEKAMSRHLPSKTKSPYLQPQSRPQSNELWPSPFSFASTSSTFNNQFCSSSIHTNRQSVIRSNLTGRGQSVNGDIGPLGLLGSSSADVTIHKDQLHLNIPHIKPHSRHLFHSSKQGISEDSGMAPPSSVSPDEKHSFPESDITSDCLGMRGIHRQSVHPSGKRHFQGISDTANDMTKQHFLSVPSYSFHRQDFGVFSHSAQQTSGVLLDSRQPNNSGIWYGSSHPT